MSKTVSIIGSGFSSLSAACYLAKAGFKVSIFEKNETFFADDTITIGDTMDKICVEFERIETGSAKHLRKFIAEAQENYGIAIDKVVLRPGLSPFELVTKETVLKVDQFFKTISGEVRKRFKNPKLISTLEFPVLFLGAKPSKTPSFYSFMNFADFGLGTWHPKGGMYEVIKAMELLAGELGVSISTNSSVEKIRVENGKVTGISTNIENIASDYVLSGADYHHSESLLDSHFEKHAQEIYDTPKWPSNPLFYANFPSVTDETMSPEGCETGFFLIPIATALEDTPELREQYFDLIIARFQELTGQQIENNIIFKESFCVNDFIEEYNSYKGNAYGMANTLLQTAFLRPKLRSKKVKNLYFTGQLTVPGPGVPPSLISGKLVSELISKSNNN